MDEEATQVPEIIILDTPTGKKTILGVTELIQIKEGDNWKTLMARMDTGAEMSSIDQKLADELKLQKIEKHKIIKSASGTTKRQVLHAQIMIKGQEYSANFSIADRTEMKYKMLIGQNMLAKGEFLIDPKINRERRKKKR